MFIGLFAFAIMRSFFLNKPRIMTLTFTLRYATQFGEHICLHLSQNGVTRVIPMRFVDTQSWRIELDTPIHNLEYHFSIRDDSEQTLREEFHSRTLTSLPVAHQTTLHLIDAWDMPNFPEHFLVNKVLENTRSDVAALAPSSLSSATHLFEIRVPLYERHQQVCLLGAHEALGHWDTEHFIPLQQVAAGVWQTALDLSAFNGTLAYKYGIFDSLTGRFVSFETGENRSIVISHSDDALTIVRDLGYRFLPEQLWRAAGVAIPIFSLRSRNALGSGEFADLKLLGDWAKNVGLSLIQVLPINDSSVNYSWDDQFPYSAISVYALHPQYVSIRDLPYTLTTQEQTEFVAEQAALNACETIDFERMIRVKWRLLRSIFTRHQAQIISDAAFAQFIDERAFWLKPYAVFCTLRDQYGTVDFTHWGADAHYSSARCDALFNPAHPQFDEVMLHCFVQYHLHLQLVSAVNYLHQLGVSLKGDLPIGVRRHSVDTWVEPQWFGMDFQAGAPPDMFSDLGQNWELPTYEWARMRADDYGWWRKRMAALSQYFDAMRIDHVLGFFRIWRISSEATQGLLGYFYPALGVTTTELAERGIEFDPQRDCAPYIRQQWLESLFGADTDAVIAQYLQIETNAAADVDARYAFKAEFNTQRKIVDHFKTQPNSTGNTELQSKLLSLHTEVLFIREQTDAGVVYHPRFNIDKTQAFLSRTQAQRDQLFALYVDYFFVRQEALWRASGMEKLPALQSATDMLICAEDLGLVPDCVPQVLDELGIVALKIQRSPKEHIPFYDPKNIGYMNVTTTSSHDSSTLRQWWTENPSLTQQYYDQQLQRTGAAPSELTPALAEQIVRQNLQSPAMLTIFPLQDWLATSAQLRRANANAERINNPADPAQRWAYRMHIELEELLQADEFNQDVAHWIALSERQVP